MQELFSNMFGDKPWFRSLTAWGLVILGVTNAFVTQVCDPDIALLSVSTCATLVKGLNMVGAAFTVLGIRKAAQAKNIA